MSDRIQLVLHREGATDLEVTVRECPACQALVAEDRASAHERFHAQMRRAS